MGFFEPAIFDGVLLFGPKRLVESSSSSNKELAENKLGFFVPTPVNGFRKLVYIII